MYSYTIILYRTYRKQIINVGTGGLLYISHIFSVKWSFGMSDKSSDIQSYLICFGSNDSFSHFSPAGPPTVPLSRGRDHLHQLQPGPTADQPEPGGEVHV